MSNIEHIFMCLLVICMSSVEKCLFRSYVYSIIGLFVFLILICMGCLYILEINPLSVALFATIFSHSGGSLFTLFIISFIVQNLLSLIRFHLFIFYFYFHYSMKWIIRDLAVIYIEECSGYIFL